MPEIDRGMIDRVRTAAAGAVERHHLPGMAVAIVPAEGPMHIETFGLADIESAAPLTPQHHQCIASITKTMVGLALMSNVEEGRLSLDARVADLLPHARFDGDPSPMTVRHLLTHTSGIGEAPSVAELPRTVNPQQRPANAAARDFETAYPHGIAVEAQPGTKWAYANHGYVLLGEILMQAEGGDTLDAILRRRIWSELGMDATSCAGVPAPSLSTGYHRAMSPEEADALRAAGEEIREEPTVDGHNIRGRYAPDFGRLNLGAGGAQSTIGDMAAYARALLCGGGGVVRPDTLAEMTAPQFSLDDRLVSWGLAFGRVPRVGRHSFGHGGAYFGGWNSTLAVFPQENIAFIGFINVMLDEPAPVFAHVMRAVFDVAVPQPRDEPLDPAVATAAPGVFELTPGRLMNFRPSRRLGRIQLAAREGGLWLYARRGAFKDGVPLRRAPGDDPALLQAWKPGGEPVTFALVRDASGAVTHLRTDDLIEMHRTDQVAPWA